MGKKERKRKKGTGLSDYKNLTKHRTKDIQTFTHTHQENSHSTHSQHSIQLTHNSPHKPKMCNWWFVKRTYVLTTDIDQRSISLHHLFPRLGLQVGVFRVFPWSKWPQFSGSYVVLAELEDEHAWNATRHLLFAGAKTWISLIGAPWLTVPLNGAV